MSRDSMSIKSRAITIDTTLNVADATASSVFDRLGVTPVINASGVYTDLGGSILSRQIWDDLSQLNDYYIRVPDLLEKTGASIARLLGTQSARVTPGACAAIALAVGACMTGEDGPSWEQLPDTSGLKNEVVLLYDQLRAYKYAVCVRMSGARLVTAGTAAGTGVAQIEMALTEKTAAIFVPAHLDGLNGAPRLKVIAEIAHARQIPVVVDAAYMNFPPDIMRSYTRAGADLVCFSAKYYGGPNAGGFVTGRSDLIRAIEGLDFTRFESGRYRSFGRGFKMGRYEIAATALALDAWFHADHELRLREYRERAEALQRLIGPLPGVTTELRCFTLDERVINDPINCLVMQFNADARLDAAGLCTELVRGSPAIAAVVNAAELLLVTETLESEHLNIIADRVRAACIAGD
jgi:D-glucosaminate-6-phosphate ammonia-lyase